MDKRLILGLAFSMMASSAFADGSHPFKKGQELYTTYCATCHGDDGRGEGSLAKQMSPPPANLQEAMQNDIVSDEYLMWTIREGGRNVHTEMPSFETEGNISEAEAKEIIKYLWHTFKS